MPKVSPRHLEERRAEILMAAYRCFSRKGFHRTTMRDIFAESGLSAGAVYRYFESKEALVEALAEVGQRNTRLMMVGDGLDGAALDDLSLILRRVLTAMDEPEGLDAVRLDLRLWGEALSNETLRAAFVKARSNVTDLVHDLIERGQRSGDIDAALDPAATARMLIALYLGLSVQRAVEEINLGDMVEQVETLITRGLAADRTGSKGGRHR